MTIDKERLIKLLSLTESDQDAEVLAAIRKSNEMLRASRTSWSDVIASPSMAPFYSPPPIDSRRQVSADWSHASRAGFERSDTIRQSIRREFPISLAFFPLWIAAELMAMLFPNTYWNKSGKRVVVAFWSLCWLGLLSWLGAGTYLLFMMRI